MQSSRLWNRHFIHLLIIEVMLQFGAYIANPIVLGYSVWLGSTVAIGGVIAGLNATVSMVARPFTGWFADRLSKKTLLLFAAVLFMIAAFGCAVADSVTVVAAMRALHGIAFAFKTAVIVSMVSLVVPHNCIGRAVGWMGLAMTVACALGPMMGSFVCALVGYSFSFIIAGAFFAVSLVLAALFKAPLGLKRKQVATIEEDDKSMSVLQRIKALRISDFFYAPAVPFAAMAGLTGAPHGVAIAFILVVGEYRGMEGVAVYFAVYSFAALVSKPIMGRVSDKKGLMMATAPMLAVEFMGTILLAFTYSIPMLVIAAICMGVGQGSVSSTLQAESVRGVSKGELGRAANTFFVGPDIGMGFGPIIAGYVMQLFGITAMFLFCSGLVFVASVILVIASKPVFLKSS